MKHFYSDIEGNVGVSIPDTDALMALGPLILNFMSPSLIRFYLDLNFYCNNELYA